MLRFAEIGLFLTPFGLYIAWRLLAPHTRPLALWIGGAVFLSLLAGAIYLGLHQRMPADARYVPPHVENGRIVPGHSLAD